MDVWGWVLEVGSTRPGLPPAPRFGRSLFCRGCPLPSLRIQNPKPVAPKALNTNILSHLCLYLCFQKKYVFF